MLKNFLKIKNTKPAGFTIVELLVVLVLAMVVIGITYQFFIKQSRVFERGDTEANLQMQGKSALEYLKQEFRLGGKDPCNRNYNKKSPQQVYAYFSVTPWINIPVILTSIANNNPAQMAVVHYDTTTGTPGNCAGDGANINNDPAVDPVNPTHYRPTRAFAYFVNDPIAYGPPPSISLGLSAVCPGLIPPNNSIGDPVRSLIKVPVIYSPDLTVSSAVALDCANAQVIATNVECFYVEYLFQLPTNIVACDAGVIGATMEVEDSSGVDQVCKITAQPGITGSYNESSLGLADTIRLTLVLKSPQPEQQYVNNQPASLCSTDTFQASGLNLTGTGYHTVTLQTSFKLNNSQ